MERKIYLQLLVVFFAITVFSSCQEKLKLEEPTDEEFTELSTAVDEIDTTQQIFETPGASNIRASFMAAFRSCQKAGDWKRIIYLGSSNKKYVGDIMSSDKTLLRTVLRDKLNSAEFQKLILAGNVSKCDLAKIEGIDFSVFLDDTRFSPEDTLISAFLTHYDSLSISEGNWQMDELKTDDLLALLENTNDPVLKSYKKSLINKGNFIITKVIKVSGFQGTVYSKNDFGIAGNAEIPTQLQAIDSFSVGLTLNVVNRKQVNVSSTGEFYVIASVLKGTKL